LNARDAIYMAEEMGLKVNVVGKGKVINQSIAQGTSLTYGSLINLELN
jgi:cell division protein FtsI (penicillin-binding protein 3)